MASCDWYTYPWGGGRSSVDNTTWGYSSSISVQPTWYYNTGGSYYPTPVPYHEKITEKVESAMDWLRRRVTEITDLAYAEV